jgi:hypothetical protein
MFVCLSGTLLIAYTFQLLIFVPGVDLGNPLMKGVSSISGGSSTIIRKSGSNTRMVMDPAGKGIIATYTNDVDGQGAIVFDASPARFSSASGSGNDNLKYTLNIAGWLEQNVNSQPQKRILIYSLADTPPLKHNALAELAKEGFAVTVSSRKETPRITENLLAGCSQLWLFFGDNIPAGLSEDEIKLVANINNKSKGMLVVASTASTGTTVEQSANSLTSRYGVRFGGIVENSREMGVSVASSLLGRTSELLGAFLKMVNKA